MSGEEEAPACPVCFSEFDSSSHSPSTLPCCHTFCCSCLRHPSLAVGGRLRCPICRFLSWGPVGVHRNANAPQELAANLPPAEIAEAPSVSLRWDPATLPWPVSFVGVDESWFLQRCALCCRSHPAGPYQLECGHMLCPGCLGLLLALASPGWVTFLYCPRCQSQTAVFHTTSTTTAPPAGPERRASASSVAEGLEHGRGRCCGLWASCALL